MTANYAASVAKTRTRPACGRAIATCLLVALVVFGSGCFQLVCSSDYATGREWTHPGAFSAMPEEGQVGTGFHVKYRYIETRDGTAVSGKNAAAEINGTEVGLMVGPDDSVLWGASRSRHDGGLPHQETAALLNETFRQLGLGAPALDDWRFWWSQEGPC